MTNELLSLQGKKWGRIAVFIRSGTKWVIPNEPDALYDALDHKLRRPVEK